MENDRRHGERDRKANGEPQRQWGINSAQVNGVVYTVTVDASTDIPASVIAVLQNAGYTVA